MGGPGTAGGLNTVGSIEGEGRILLNTDKAHLSVNVSSSEKIISLRVSFLAGLEPIPWKERSSRMAREV